MWTHGAPGCYELPGTTLQVYRRRSHSQPGRWYVRRVGEDLHHLEGYPHPPLGGFFTAKEAMAWVEQRLDLLQREPLEDQQ